MLCEITKKEGILMITAIFAELTAIVTGLIAAITQGFEDIVPIFWVSGTGLTVIGSLSLITAGVSIVSMTFGFVIKLIKFRVRG